MTGLSYIKADWEYDGLAYAPMDTDDFTLGLMMDCWVKIIYRKRRRDDSYKKNQICVCGSLLRRRKKEISLTILS